MAEHIYGVHDFDPAWGALVRSAGKSAWSVETLEIGDNPDDLSGGDFRSREVFGVTPIGRLNYSHHGNGTIPLPSRYTEFSIRSRNFVRASHYCTHWIIGNEPNLSGERPEGAFIAPEQYARCFSLCYKEIKKVGAQHQVLVAAVAPYNVDSGSWILYWKKMLEWLEVVPDGFALHTYGRGPDPASIYSEQKMDAPYQAYYNGFRGYRDLLREVPKGMQHLPAYITETDQIVPWADQDSEWVRTAYQEIDDWNRAVGTQKIHCLALYRWYDHDQWVIQRKRAVVDSFAETLNSTNFRVPVSTGGNIVVIPYIASGSGKPTALVTAPAGANLRSGPGLNYPILGAIPKDAMLPVTGKNANGEWWQVEDDMLGKVWVSGTVVRLENVVGVQVVNISPPPTPSKPDRAWVVSSWCRILGIELRVMQAILKVESNGRAFEGNRMIIRFENHVFHDQVQKHVPHLQSAANRYFQYGSPRHTGHKWRRSESEPWRPQHTGIQREEWEVFEFARSIHEAVAMNSISMGTAQIMGFNHRKVGYATVQDMFHAYNDPHIGELNQVTGLFAYIFHTDSLLDAVRNKNWVRIGVLYNGSESYGPILEAAYDALG